MTSNEFGMLEETVLGLFDLLAVKHQTDLATLQTQLAGSSFASGSGISAACELARAGALLRAERQKQGIQLSEFQAATGMIPSALSRIENLKDPNPTIGTLNRIAAVLGKKLVVALADK